jgi:soluble P-type ATPase
LLTIAVPGDQTYNFEHLVLDYNGTVAFNGKLLSGVSSLFYQLSNYLEIHVITADTFGSAARELSGLPVKIRIIGKRNQDEEKEKLIDSLGREKCIAMGNGKNDRKMLKAAAVGVCVIQEEGASAEAVLNSDIITHSITDALGLLLHPKRISATLRN